MHINIKKKYLSYKNYKVKCAVGKKGINIKKKEGDLVTPKGKFKVLKVFYRRDRVKNLKTNLKKIIIDKKMGWCDDPNSPKYNMLVKYPFNFKSEKLYRRDNIYDIIFVLNYNSNPIKKNKGSAIFIHIAKRYFNPTKGCIAIKKSEILKLAKVIDKKSIIKIG